MSSIDAGTPPEPGNGRPPAAPAPRRGLRDRPLGRLFLLALVLVAALVAARTCASADKNVTQEEAMEIAIAHAPFEPCPEKRCRQIKYLNQGIPVVGYWGIVLSERLDEDGRPNRIASYLVNASTGAISQR
jgi:hypothetical protein